MSPRNSNENEPDAIVLSVDPGKNAGWSIFRVDEKNNLFYLDSGTIRYKTNMLQYEDEIKKLIAEKLPDKILIEEPTFCRNLKTYAVLRDMYVIWRLVAERENIPVETVTIQELQRIWWGYRKKVKKEKAVEYVKNKYKIKVNNHIADSIVNCEFWTKNKNLLENLRKLKKSKKHKIKKGGRTKNGNQ